MVIEDCNEALRLNPKYQKALTRRATACEQSGDLTQALEGMSSNFLWKKILKWYSYLICHKICYYYLVHPFSYLCFAHVQVFVMWKLALRFFFKDVTAVCILEGFQNPQSLVTADRVLKSLGQAKAKEEFKVRLSYFLELSHSMKRLWSMIENYC